MESDYKNNKNNRSQDDLSRHRSQLRQIRNETFQNLSTRDDTDAKFQYSLSAELPSLSLKLGKGGADSIENKFKAKGRLRKIAWGEFSRVRFIR